MSAATITPAVAGSDLLGDLRELLGRHETAATLDDVREIADELTAVLRRARGRLVRLARKTTAEATPAPAPPAPAPPPAPVEADHRARGLAELSRLRCTPVPPAPPRPAPHRARRPARSVQAPARRAPAPRRVSTGRYLLTAAVIATATLAGRTGRRLRALARRAAAALTRRRPAAAAFELPRPGDAPALSTWRRSPLEVAAALQDRKGRAYDAYQNTVLLWELGTRAASAAEVVTR